MIQLLVFCSFLAIIRGAAVPQTIGHQELIVGGTNTSISDVPYQVALLVLNEFWCGGAILTPTYILTAAHCIKDIVPIIKLYVRAGSSLYEDGGVVIAAKRINIHPKFNNFLSDYDIGVVELSASLNFTKNIQPIKLGSSAPPDGAIVRASGWGRTWALSSTKPLLSKWLQSVEIPMINREVCKKKFDGSATITPRMICAGGGKQTPCNGDSGGPLTYNGQLIGVVSFEIDCGAKNYPSVYTNTADPEIRAYIKQNIPINE